MKGKLLKIFDTAYKMSALTRFSQTHLVNDESVLEHTGFVCLTSLLICNRIISKGESIDIGLVLAKATVHDLDEIITGDIPRPTKYYTEEFRNIIQKIENENMEVMSNDLDDQFLHPMWSQSKDFKEGLIVDLTDALAILYKVYYEEVMFGNKTLSSHLPKMEDRLLSIRARSSSLFSEDEIKNVIDEAISIYHLLNSSSYKES